MAANQLCETSATVCGDCGHGDTLTLVAVGPGEAELSAVTAAPLVEATRVG